MKPKKRKYTKRKPKALATKRTYARKPNAMTITPISMGGSKHVLIITEDLAALSSILKEYL